MNWSTYDGRERAKNTKYDQILSFHKFLDSAFTKRLIQVLPYCLHYSEIPISLLPELVQTLAVTLTHRMQKTFHQVDYD